ncbi:MAG: indole-3-glycerol phosphate synthase TrpC [bacterium]
MNILEEIVRYKRKEVERKKMFVKDKDYCGMRSIEHRDFKKSIMKKEITLIAEIKKKSPSAGNIVVDFSPERLARIYDSAGADAISVLTDEKYFGGNEKHIALVKKSSKLSVLRKEFIIDEYQIYESDYLGADAILLIAGILDQNQLKKFAKIATGLNLAVIIEVRNKTEITRALNAGAEIIGVNNRDLRDFRIDMVTSLKLCPLIPEGIIKVSESGIRTPADIRRLKEAGFDAVLVGTSILQSADICRKIAELKVQEV